MRRRSLLFLVVLLAASCSATPSAAPGDPVRILLGEPSTLDPAAMGDASSATIVSQLFETVTTFDADGRLQPALADAWQIEGGGRRVIFHLRDGQTFSDGTPLRASDVVRSWLRIVDPQDTSPLATLMLDVRGAAAYLGGGADASDVGLQANDETGEVIVDLERPTSDFVSIVASPTFGVVPRGTDADAFTPGPGFVASGGYRLTAAGSSELTLTANERYWAGPPAIGSVVVVTDLGGGSAVEAFRDGTLDYAPIGESDADWIVYDEALGPQLREVPSLVTDFYGFDTSSKPFDDIRVRQAVAAAVDWRRIARLAVTDDAAVATSMVPPGIPGRSDRDVVPLYDPARARALLAEAGYPAGQGFPSVAIVSGGSPYDEAVISELRRELGIGVRTETMDFDTYFSRLDEEPPAMWFLTWVADYPGRNDFLGVLLHSGAVNNYGRWASPEFDAAIESAGAATGATEAGTAYDLAEDIVQREVPVIPVTYGAGWALSRHGLLGAGQNGMGIVRLAGLAWAS